MASFFLCAHCGERVPADGLVSGENANCPGCKKDVLIPERNLYDMFPGEVSDEEAREAFLRWVNSLFYEPPEPPPGK